jgi:peptide/nickel transport system substrate-binding protein
VSRSKVFLRVFALGLVGALALAACGGSDSDDSSSPTVPSSGSSGPPDAGTLVLAAEQEPDCADWIASCAGLAWGSYIMQYQTMPLAFTIAKSGSNWTYVPSNVLAEPPTVTPGPPQVVTYKINPAAVWSDGTPITSADFKYTWEQIAKGKDVYSKTGYENIESVDDTDPATAVVTFKADEPFGPWKSLFGTDYGIWPSHILAGKNRDAATKDGYKWSGGPWKIESWNRGIDVTLVPNDNYWGEKPKISKVIFKFIPDTTSQFKAFQTGEVLGIYPTPQLDTVDAIKKGLPDAKTVYTADTGSIEALWMNNAKAPLDSVAVRQAIAYAIDRDAIVTRLFGDLGVTEASQSLNPPITSEFGDQQAWAGYTLDLQKVDQLLTGDGWAKGGDGVYAKNGKKLSLTINTTADNQLRELTEQILQEQLKAAGIDLKIKNQSADQLFGTTLVEGNYQMALFAQTNTNLDPGLCVIMCSANIPAKSNDNSGQNYTRTNIPALDPLLQTVDQSSDDALRDQSQTQADQLMAENQVTLPLDPLPNIAIWSNRISGNLSDNPIMAMFWNMNTWQLQG